MQIQILGVPTDVNSSYRRGAATAPAAIRQAWRRYAEFGNAATESGLETRQRHRPSIDLGDVAVHEDRVRTTRSIAAAAEQAARSGPLLAIGGDHSVTFPLVEGLAAVHGPLNLLHFDAHPDLYHDYEGNPRSHASPFARIMERGPRPAAGPGRRPHLEPAQPRAGAAVRRRSRRVGRLHARDGADSRRARCTSRSTSTRSIRRSRPASSHPEPGGLQRARRRRGACPHPHARSSAPTSSS